VDADALRVDALAAGPITLPANRPLVGMLARLEPVKGPEHFVRAAARLREGGSEAAFVIAGEGSERERLESLADEAGVTLLGNVASPAGYLAALDIVVVPSLSEAFGLVAAEASALGKPVVASGVGGLREVVVHGVSGLFVPPGDPTALVDAIGGLLGDPAERSRMGKAGEAIVRERFSPARMADELLAIYRDVARAGKER
jgi:glycosyltransferase involved in cell wall biosynthesis